MRVFIVCNAYCTTGGIEAVHQLVDVLKKKSISVYIIYLEKEHCEYDPTPQIYKKYGAEIASEYLNAEDSVLITPEIHVYMRDWCRKGQSVIWWLSVDNAPLIDGGGELAKENIVHFAQSHYAKKYLEQKLGVECSYLSDYISDEIRKYADYYRDSSIRKNLCFYNPKKGYERICELIANTKGRFEWVPLQGMSPEDVAKVLCTGKVYIDFGNHPGKDRIPREAAYCGCCIITNRRGSAEFYEDVAIPETYKIDDSESCETILGKIEYIMHNYDTEKEKFYDYVDKIRREKEIFEDEVNEAVEILQKNIELSHKNKQSETSKDDSAISKYFHMMNHQMEELIETNKKAESLIMKEKNYNQAVDILLKQDGLHKELLKEVWELLQYLAE